MIIDHIGISVSDYDKSLAFYTKALAPLGIFLVIEIQGWAGFGNNKEKAEFWFGPNEKAHNPMHISFLGTSRQQVDAFYAAAIEAGVTCNGEPGLREIYHSNYYGTFVIDPDGYNIEAVCHNPE